MSGGDASASCLVPVSTVEMPEQQFRRQRTSAAATASRGDVTVTVLARLRSSGIGLVRTRRTTGNFDPPKAGETSKNVHSHVFTLALRTKRLTPTTLLFLCDLYR